MKEIPFDCIEHLFYVLVVGNVIFVDSLSRNGDGFLSLVQVRSRERFGHDL